MEPMKATVIQKQDQSFTTSILSTEANQFRSELRGEGIKSDETVSVQEGKEFTAFSFAPKVAIEEIEKLLETVGYNFTTNQIA
jgi:hypothetical protein